MSTGTEWIVHVSINFISNFLKFHIFKVDFKQLRIAKKLVWGVNCLYIKSVNNLNFCLQTLVFTHGML